MYVPFAANTTQTTEGTVGSGISINVLTTTATISNSQWWNIAYEYSGEYADYAKVKAGVNKLD